MVHGWFSMMAGERKSAEFRRQITPKMDIDGHCSDGHRSCRT